jgi:hypothetical protein
VFCPLVALITFEKWDVPQQGQISTALVPLRDHPKSCIGSIKINLDGWQAIDWVFCLLVALITFEKWDVR